ncbi:MULTISPECIES: exonuclease domain-containing protein [unclassified Variovorax]|uniref:3'-5' exonuclease n=1 Tax=unclassified Variovorax TaxID=663243 RepID=UPI00076D1048|nr:MULTISPECIES: exonuclease domain-containing protein [unclassified Variovorax]KWT96817.1 DNA polymerase III epsilon subunit [Variovorax sp. WDL1]
MKPDARELAAMLGPGAVLALAGVGLGAMLAATLSPAEREALGAVLGPRAALLLMGWAVLALALGALGRRAHAFWVKQPARVAEAAQALLVAGDAKDGLPARAATACPAGTRALAEVAERLARERDALRADIAAQVQEAARGIEHERSRLAALMSELTQSVIVCNLDGRILLYNPHARLQFHALSPAAGAELVGLGRSIYAVFDRQLVAHALESIQHRLERGAAQPAAQFVTSSRAGQLLRVQMAPVRDPSAAPGNTTQLSGFVLMLHNITREFEQDSERDRLMHALTEGSRSSLGSLQAAVDMLELPDLDAPARERFLNVVREEVRTMTERIQSIAASAGKDLKTRWPLEEMLGADLLHAAVRHIEARTPMRASASDVDAGLWLRVDSYSLLQALASLATRLSEEFAVRRVQLRLQREGERAHLDLVWQGTPISTETAIGWESSPMTVGDEASLLSVRDVVERHGGAFWFQRERARQEAFFRFLLPLTQPQEQLEAASVLRSGSRPEYYDFDLFGSGAQTHELGGRRLVDLAYTVFDTETTGLDPSQGDEILQIGAARIVNGKVLRQECFEQLVNPGRGIPAAGIPIHGITPELVAGQPSIGEVLPAFHAFASDTVLVAHNAAFDLRFLQMKEAATGLRFDQPVLDTLLLSAVASPQQASHELEAIAERLGIPVLGRHTALGDALLTAEVFLRLIPLLAMQGIHTLDQAREAAQRTWYARLSY